MEPLALQRREPAHDARCHHAVHLLAGLLGCEVPGVRRRRHLVALVLLHADGPCDHRVVVAGVPRARRRLADADGDLRVVGEADARIVEGLVVVRRQGAAHVALDERALASTGASLAHPQQARDVALLALGRREGRGLPVVGAVLRVLVDAQDGVPVRAAESVALLLLHAPSVARGVCGPYAVGEDSGRVRVREDGRGALLLVAYAPADP